MSSGPTVGSKAAEAIVRVTLPWRSLTAKRLQEVPDRRIIRRNPGSLFCELKRRGGIAGFAAEADECHDNIPVVWMPGLAFLQLSNRLLRAPGRMQCDPVDVSVSRIVAVKLGSTA